LNKQWISGGPSSKEITNRKQFPQMSVTNRFHNEEFQMNKEKPQIIETEINSPNVASLLRLMNCSSSPQIPPKKKTFQTSESLSQFKNHN
jgi:hypothetical protein